MMLSQAQKNYPVLETMQRNAFTHFSADFDCRFDCPQESMRYAGALEQLFFSKLNSDAKSPLIVEFGSGSGLPVIAAILDSGFSGIVHGYEINPEEAKVAEQLIKQHGLTKNYFVHNQSFFNSTDIPAADFLIANPPYLPADNSEQLTLPYLYGGPEGMTVSQKLFALGYSNVFLEISSYSNPVALINFARAQGYRLVDFQITQLPFGIYSRQEIVQKRIREMRTQGRAFYSENCYLVGSGFFSKKAFGEPDLSDEFLASLTAL